jgi:hypothetical protein
MVMQKWQKSVRDSYSFVDDGLNGATHILNLVEASNKATAFQGAGKAENMECNLF